MTWEILFEDKTKYIVVADNAFDAKVKAKNLWKANNDGFTPEIIICRLKGK